MPMDRAEQYGPLLQLAERAALLAGDYLNKNRANLKTVTSDAARDVKLNADRESETIIIDVLTSSGLPILSEEVGFVPSDKKTSLRWIVDPLDGTVNYFEGLPICCVSVALWENDSPVLGVVYDFIHGNLYRGIVGVGAWFNDVEMRIKKARPVNQSILCTGFPIAMDFSNDSLVTFTKHVRCFKKVRLFGSAAMSLAFVASAKADAYYERSIKIWDVAAGLALVKAAGGIIDVRPQSTNGIVDVYAGTDWLLENL